MPNGLPLLSLFIYMPSTSASDATGLCTDGYVRALFLRGFVDAHCFRCAPCGERAYCFSCAPEGSHARGRACLRIESEYCLRCDCQHPLV